MPTLNIDEALAQRKPAKTTPKLTTAEKRAAVQTHTALGRIAKDMLTLKKGQREHHADLRAMAEVLGSYLERDKVQRKLIITLYDTATETARHSVDGLMRDLGMVSNWGRGAE